jgi:hypothetical protein
MPAISALLRRLWHDDAGAVVSVELVTAAGLAVGTAVTLGVGVRNGVTAACAQVTDAIRACAPDPAAVRQQLACPGPGAWAPTAPPGQGTPYLGAQVQTVTMNLYYPTPAAELPAP